MKPLCIYHGNCADGFGAAWVLWKHFKGEVDFYPGVYQRLPPDVTGRDVIMVDFSYKRATLDLMIDRARSVLIIDHHKTAAEDIGDWLRVSTWEAWQDVLATPGPGDFAAFFDMRRSGAGLAWDFFNPGESRPKLINHIEDRDLWRFALPFTREIQASMFSLPYHFETWDDRIESVENNRGLLNDIINEGEAIERKHFKDIEELIAVVTRPMVFRVPIPGGYQTAMVPVANLPYTMTADAGHLLCGCDLFGHVDPVVKHPFAGCYWDKPDGRQFSLRSQDDGADVSEIAKLYSGGGHARASGFLVPYSRLAEFEP